MMRGIEYVERLGELRIMNRLLTTRINGTRVEFVKTRKAADQKLYITVVSLKIFTFKTAVAL